MSDTFTQKFPRDYTAAYTKCATVQKGKDAYLLSLETKLTRVNLQLNLCPSKLTTPVLKRIVFNTLK